MGWGCFFLESFYFKHFCTWVELLWQEYLLSWCLLLCIKSLDVKKQVRDRYVIPLVKHLKEMLGFRKFKRGAKSEVDEVLRAEKLEYPMRVVYCFGISYEHPGTFILSYIKSRNLHHEYVGLLPNGFKFRKQTFEKIEHLVGLFQKNIDRLQHTSLTLGNLAFGNSSGACTIGGLQGQLNCSKDRSISRGKVNHHLPNN